MKARSGGPSPFQEKTRSVRRYRRLELDRLNTQQPAPLRPVAQTTLKRALRLLLGEEEINRLRVSKFDERVQPHHDQGVCPGAITSPRAPQTLPSHSMWRWSGGRTDRVIVNRSGGSMAEAI